MKTIIAISSAFLFACMANSELDEKKEKDPFLNKEFDEKKFNNATTVVYVEPEHFYTY
mgnify:FL=1